MSPRSGRLTAHVRPAAQCRLLRRAWERVRAASNEKAYAPLAAPKGYTLAPEQLSEWHLQLPVLRAALADLPTGVDAAASAAPAPWIHLEFDIPRLGRWVDAVLVTQKCVIPIEFEVGAKKFERLDIEQAWDYGHNSLGHNRSG